MWLASLNKKKLLTQLNCFVEYIFLCAQHSSWLLGINYSLKDFRSDYVASCVVLISFIFLLASRRIKPIQEPSLKLTFNESFHFKKSTDACMFSWIPIWPMNKFSFMSTYERSRMHSLYTMWCETLMTTSSILILDMCLASQPKIKYWFVYYQHIHTADQFISFVFLYDYESNALYLIHSFFAFFVEGILPIPITSETLTCVKKGVRLLKNSFHFEKSTPVIRNKRMKEIELWNAQMTNKTSKCTDISFYEMFAIHLFIFIFTQSWKTTSKSIVGNVCEYFFSV